MVPSSKGFCSGLAPLRFIRIILQESKEQSGVAGGRSPKPAGGTTRHIEVKLQPAIRSIGRYQTVTETVYGA